MLRKLALSTILLPVLLVAQGPAKLQADRTRALDAAAKSPFFTQRGADAVKRVIAGADSMKQDEKVADVLDPKLAPAGKAAAEAGAGAPVLPGAQQPQQQQAPPPEPTFGWRLVGISYGRKEGMALFTAENKQMTVVRGSELDPDTKVLSVSRSKVVLFFHGKRLSLTPW